MIQEGASIFESKNYFPGGWKDIAYPIFPAPHEPLVTNR